MYSLWIYSARTDLSKVIINQKRTSFASNELQQANEQFQEAIKLGANLEPYRNLLVILMELLPDDEVHILNQVSFSSGAAPLLIPKLIFDHVLQSEEDGHDYRELIGKRRYDQTDEDAVVATNMQPVTLNIRVHDLFPRVELS